MLLLKTQDQSGHVVTKAIESWVPLEYRRRFYSAGSGQFVDSRKRAFFNHEYIKANPLIPNSVWTTPAFQINGTPAQFARRGCRPTFSFVAKDNQFNPPYTVKKEGVGHNLWRIYDGNNNAKSFVQGDGFNDNPQWLVMEMIGGGGGGSGGSSALNGVGGGAGAFALFFLDGREQLSFFVEVGTAGNGSSNRGQAGSGGATSLYVGESADSANLIISCGGGGGGDGGNPGDGGTVTLGPRSDLIVMIHNSTGSNGYAGLSGTHTFDATTLSCGLEGETQCEKTYGPYSVESNEAGAGGNSFFGAGGSTGGSYGDGGNAPISTARGAGGGGGRMKPFGSTTGGSGMTGTFAIYY